MDIYTQNNLLIKFNNKLSKPVEINKGLRQGCPLSPPLFNIYLDEIITKCQNQDITGIKLKKPATVNAVICRRPSHNSRNRNLQKVEHKLSQIITEYGLTVSVQKTKSMAFKLRDTVITKIVMDNKTIEQVSFV